MKIYTILHSSLEAIAAALRKIFNATSDYSITEMVNLIENRTLGLPKTIEAGDFPIYGITTSEKIEDSSYTDLGIFTFTAVRAGTYRFKWCCMKSAVGGGSGNSTALYLNNEQQYENSTFNNNVNFNEVDITVQPGDTVSIKGRHSGLYATYIYGVSVCIKWDDANAFFL